MISPLRCLVLITTLFGGMASAQLPVDRRSREQPEVVPRAGDGRYGTCDVLLFNKEGDRLHAAGDDKVITIWRHGENGLEADPAKTEVLLWPAWREQLGGIKSLDLSPDGKRVVLGGLGLRPSSVCILEHNPLTGTTKQLLTWPFAPVQARSFGAVLAVAYSTTGKSVAFATQDGNIWLWYPDELKTPDAAGRWCNLPLWLGSCSTTMGQGPGSPRAVPEFPIQVFFREGDSKVVALGEQGTVVEFTVQDPKTLGTEAGASPAAKKVLFNVNDGEKRFAVFKSVYDRPRDRLVVASDATGRVLIRSLSGKPAEVLTLPPKTFVRSLAVHPDSGALAIAVGSVVPGKKQQATFHNDADDEIRIYSKNITETKPTRVLRMTGQAEAMTFHPTLDRLAIAGGDASEVTLYDLDQLNKPRSVVRGSGRRIWELALASDGQAMGLRTRRDPGADQPNGRGAGPWKWMNLTEVKPTATAPQSWNSAVSSVDGWSIEPHARDRDTWFAVHKDGARIALSYNTYAFNKPTCFTFLKGTEQVPTRLILGHYYGASLFELPSGNTKIRSLSASRVFIGHSGEVLSIAAVDDTKGGWFITGGADHTIAAFNLAPWSNNPNLGVAIETEGTPARLKVTRVEIGSPGWEAGFQVGDEILLLASGGETLYDVRPAGKPEDGKSKEVRAFELDVRTGDEPARDSEADIAKALALIGKASPAHQLYFRVRTRAGTTRDIATSVKQRPLWKFYQTFTPDDSPDEWIAWMWKSSIYKTTSPNGDAQIGWLLNGPTPNFSPRFHPLSQFRGYQKDEILKSFIRERDLAKALDQIERDPNRPTSRIGEAEPAPIHLSVDRQEITTEPVTVQLSVDRRGSDVDQLPERVELWLNDYRLKVWTPDPLKPFTSDPVVIPPELFRSEDKRKIAFGDNVLTVQTRAANGSRATETRILTNRNEQPVPRLLGLAIGVDDYKTHRNVSGIRGLVSDLKYATADADLVAECFESHVGTRRYFSAGKLTLRKDAEVVKQPILDTLAKLAEEANPNDLLVLYLAGHGQLIGSNGNSTEVIDPEVTNPRKRYKDVRFAFCCPDFNTGKPGTSVVYADELFEALSGINCRKMVVLDVCHSGWATRTDVIRQFVPDGLGPFVLAACGPGQKSNELEDLKHGLFTSAFSRALSVAPRPNSAFHKADQDDDGKLTCQELYDYVRKTVSEAHPDQTPMCFPERARLPRTVVVSNRR